VAQPLDITLAIIVKNESKLLRELLLAHRELWDEAVVVDTGSTDGSASTAADCGAQVESFAWCDDFSAARNYGLNRASGRWILVLDCDENIAQGDFATIRELARSTPGSCHILPQWNYTDGLDHVDWTPTPVDYRSHCRGAAGYVPAWSIRLFPNQPELRYSGRVHEDLTPAVADLKWPIHELSVPIHHQGHRQSAGKCESRKRLYGKLLREKIKAEPWSCRARCELAVQLLEEGRTDLAQRLLERTVTDTAADAEVHRAYLLLGRILCGTGQWRRGTAELDRAVALRPDRLGCWREISRALVLQGAVPRARLYLEQGLLLFPEDPVLKNLAAQVFAASADNKTTVAGN